MTRKKIVVISDLDDDESIESEEDGEDDGSDDVVARYKMGGETLDVTNEEAYGTSSFAEDDLESLDIDLSGLMHRYAVAAPVERDGSASPAKNIPFGCRQAASFIDEEERTMFGGHSGEGLGEEEELNFD